MRNGPEFRCGTCWRPGLLDDATEIVFKGADRGAPKEKPVPPIVPGDYATASVKWLTGIHAIRGTFAGY